MPEISYILRDDVQAQSVWIEDRYVCLSLANKSEFRFPAENNKKLALESDADLAKAELICNGTGLHWEALDEDLTVSGILDGRFG